MSREDRDFLDGLHEIGLRVEHATEEAVGAAIAQVLDDAVNKAPRIPHDEGSLQGSGSGFVQSKHVATSASAGGEPTPATSYAPPLVKDEVLGTIGFNTPYAAYQHEGHRADGSHPVNPDNYTRQDGRGPKFLEDALAENANDYMRIVARRMGKAFEGGG